MMIGEGAVDLTEKLKDFTSKTSEQVLDDESRRAISGIDHNAQGATESNLIGNIGHVRGNDLGLCTLRGAWANRPRSAR